MTPQAYTGNGWPDYTAWVDNTWGSGQEGGCAGWPWWAEQAIGLVFGKNPPYYLDNFLAFSPKFFGPPTQLANCTTVVGSNAITVPSTQGLMAGQFLQSVATPPGTVITAITGATTLTTNNTATAASSTAVLTVYTQPVVPVAVIQLYLTLAAASLPQVRWVDSWMLGMALYIGHYCTLWAETDASDLNTAWQTIIHEEAPVGTAGHAVYTISYPPPGGVLQSLTNNGLFLVPGVAYNLVGATITLTAPSDSDALWAAWPVQAQVQTPVPATAGQIAAQGVMTGIMVSKSVGDVSASYQALAALEGWAAWGMTKYGTQFATIARVIGAGPILFR